MFLRMHKFSRVHPKILQLHFLYSVSKIRSLQNGVEGEQFCKIHLVISQARMTLIPKWYHFPIVDYYRIAITL